MTAHKHTYDESLTCACGHCIRLNGVWPSQTWFQTRLAYVRIKEAKAVIEVSDEM